MRRLSYSGISVGWGWERHTCAGCTNARNNAVRANRIERYKTKLNDGGGVYMLGASLAARYLEKKTHRFFYFFAPPPFLFPRVHPRLTR